MGGAWRWFYRLFWIVPLAYAIMRVPIDRFLWLFYHTIFGSSADAIAVTGVTGLESPFIPWQNGYMDQVFVLLLGVGFFVLSLTALLWPVRAIAHPCRHTPLVTYSFADDALVPRSSPAEGDVVAALPETVQQRSDMEKEPVLLDPAAGDGARGGDTTPHQKVVIQR